MAEAKPVSGGRQATPRGKDEVIEALVDAATALFAQRGPGAVSVRDIAGRAGVNHGLVHRHFGSKGALVRAVLDKLVEGLRARYSTGLPAGFSTGALFDEFSNRETYWRVLARAVLDGHIDWLGRARFPLVRAGVEYVRTTTSASGAASDSEAESDVDPEALVATYLAAALGWLVFEPFLTAATGMKGSARVRKRRMLRTWDYLQTIALSPGERE